MATFQSMISPLLSRRNLLTASALVAAATLPTAIAAAEDAKVDIATLPRVKQKLVAPPFLPEHEQIAHGGPKIIEVELVIEEKKIVLEVVRPSELLDAPRSQHLFCQPEERVVVRVDELRP